MSINLTAGKYFLTYCRMSSRCLSNKSVNPLLSNDNVNNAFAGQQIPNTHQKTNQKDMFSTRSVRQLRDAIIKTVGSGVFYAARAEVL
jgi:hypothetical protein